MIRDGKDPAAIAEAAAVIRSGGQVGFATETVYGLGADASSDAAVAGIFTAKGRPSDHPLIVHVADPAQVSGYAASVPPFASRLMQAFWPGPLTLILPRRPGVAAAAACATGVAAPSANRFGRVSPTTAQHVADEFGDGLLVLDGGPCEIGIESSIVDCTRSRPVLLRPGVLTRAQLEGACGEPVLSNEEFAGAPRASGTLASHYAPDAKVRLMNAQAIQTALDLLGPDAAHIAVYARAIVRIKSTQVLYRRMPDDAPAAAQQLFAVLRGFDAQGVKLIWVEHPPAETAWDGVRDRLVRAAAG
jgi:L-threonylcarbamoyladenylate synthase